MLTTTEPRALRIKFATLRRGGGALAAVAALLGGLLLNGAAGPEALAAGSICGIPGSDGPVVLSGVVNTYYPPTAPAAAGATSITLGAANGAVQPIAAGDLLLVIQMQDAAIDSTNTASYGGPTAGTTALNATGLYEYVVATNSVPTGGGVLNLSGTGAGSGLNNSYTEAAATAGQGQRRFQVVRVPQYSSATLTSTLTAAPWNGTTGGVLALDVAGATNLGAATVSVAQMGFRAGLGRQLAGGAGGTGTDYRNLSSLPFHGDKAEGIAGTPAFMYDSLAAAAVSTGIEGYPNGSTARGAPGNAGGGGTDPHPSANDQNTGGGGGGNGGSGGIGGNSWFSNLAVGGLGGAAFTPGAGRVVLGGGGGSGSRNNSSGVASSGGNGGGIVLLRTGSISGAGTITADGGVGVTPLNDGGGGGGAGGSVVVLAQTGGLGGLQVNARGGRGTDAWPTNPGPAANFHGPGGGGGGGAVFTSSAPAGANVSGGVNGTTTTLLASYGAAPGAAGVAGAATAVQISGASAGSACLPALTVTKSTSTPAVVNTPGGTTATYTISVVNAAGLGSALSAVVSDALPAGFTYASTVTVTATGGSTRTSVSDPVVGATSPAWGAFTIPGGGSVQITFIAAVAASVPPATYQNPATATYSDPTRSVGGGTTQSSYDPSSSSAEDVSVQVPDLVIAKSHVNPFVRGASGTYTLRVSNAGNIASSGVVTVSDTLPGGLVPGSATGTGWSCATVGQAVTCTRADPLGAAGSYPPISVPVAISQVAGASLTNTASVAGGGELNTSNDTASDPTSVVSSADVALLKTVSNPNPGSGQNVVFTVTATNNGPSDASGVQVADLLPAGVTFVSAAASAGTTYDPVSGLWTIGPLANGASAQLLITATVTGSGLVVNTARKIAENEPDPNGANDSASAGFPALDLGVTKTVDFPTPLVGTSVSFTIGIHNAGPATAAGVSVTDALPAGLTYQSSVASQGSYNPGSGVWSVGTLGNAASATLQIKALVAKPGRVVNTALVQPGAWFDPNSSNDSANTAVDGQTLPAAPDTGIGPAGPAAPAVPLGEILLVAWLLGLAALVWSIGFVSGRREAGGAQARLLVAVLAVSVMAAPLPPLAAQQFDHGASASSGLRPEIGDRQLFGKDISLVPPDPPAGTSSHAATGPVLPTRLRIPTLGVDVNVEAVGVSRSGAMDVPGNLWNAGWLDTGPLPGAPGQAVLDGHKNSTYGPGLFNKLGQLQAGDRVYVSDRAGGELAFEVTRLQSFPLSAFDRTQVFGPAVLPELNLITCVGAYSAQTHTYDHRLVVFTRLIGAAPAS